MTLGWVQVVKSTVMNEKKGAGDFCYMEMRKLKFVVHVIRAAVAPGKDKASTKDFKGSVPPHAISRPVETS